MASIPPPSTHLYDDLLIEQWHVLRFWLSQPEVLAARDRPCVLDGWTVGDLVAHLGRSFTPLQQSAPSPEEEPLTFGAYISAYPAAATQIADGTRALAADLADDLLGGLDVLVAPGFDALAALPAGTIRAPRGPITRDDLVITRLLELVVHSDDLARSLPELAAPPLADLAVALVAASLAQAYHDRTGVEPDVSDPRSWIRLAAGREPSHDPDLPVL